MKNAWTFNHISLTVRDIFKAVKYYQSFGAVVLKEPAEEPGGEMNWKVRGKIPAKLKFIGAQLQFCSLHIEMHQPLEGDSIWQDKLDKNGEGADHIGFSVDDLKSEAAKLAKNGFTEILSVADKDKKMAASFADTRQVGNVAMQLYQGAPFVIDKPSNMDWTFAHLGFVIRDIDKGIKHFQNIGAKLVDGPAAPDFDLSGWRLYGKIPSKIITKSCHLEIGGLLIEIHQPVIGKSPFSDFLDKNGEGVDHIGFYVDDVEKEMKKMMSKGFPLILSMCEGEKAENWVGVFMDTRKEGDVIIELSNRAFVEANRTTWKK